MWLWMVLSKIAGLVVVSGTLDFNFLSQNRRYVPTSQINCYEYAKFNTDTVGRAFNDDWRSQKTALRKVMSGSFSAPTTQRRYNSFITRRSIDSILPFKNDIFKEHAKLVQDINSLKQVVFVPPLATDDNRDYDESIFHETIETFSTTPKPKTTKPTKASSIPVLLLGGASNNQFVKSPSIAFPQSTFPQSTFPQSTFPKSTINLVGTTGLPLLKHPYPFVVQMPQKPLRVCMPTMATTTHKPSLWERLIKTLIPR